MASMDGLGKNKTKIENTMKGAGDSIVEMGDEFKRVTESLLGMPEGLDSEVSKSIKNVETQGREEVTKDIEQTKSSIIDQAKIEADSLKTDVTTKIAENTSARRNLEGITSKYGKDAVAKAKTAIDTNSQKGHDIIKDLEAVIQQTDKTVQDVKNKIGTNS